MPCSVASDLGLHCLPMSHKKDARLTGIWLKHCLNLLPFKNGNLMGIYSSKLSMLIVQLPPIIIIIIIIIIKYTNIELGQQHCFGHTGIEYWVIF